MTNPNLHLEIFPYDDWNDDYTIVPTHCFDNLTDAELLALPADVMMDAYRRTAQGGLYVEGGDEVASVELIKRIDDCEAGLLDVCCTISYGAVDTLHDEPHPYCNTDFGYEYIPPRVAHPRLPESKNPVVSNPGVEFVGLAGLPKCLAAAIEVVHMQRRLGGDATILAEFYASVWGLHVDTFIRPYIGASTLLSEIELISAYDNCEYLTYIDPAWQAVVVSNRPAISNDSYGPRAMLHWERVFLLARLQTIKGLLATDISPRKLDGKSLYFRIDAPYVHHHHPRPHTLALPPTITITSPTPSSLLRYIQLHVVTVVETAIYVSVTPNLGGLAVGEVGGLQLVAPTQSAHIRSAPTMLEITGSISKVKSYFSKDVYPITPGIALMAVLTRLLDSLEILHEVHLLMIVMLNFLCKVLTTTPGVKERLRKIDWASHYISRDISCFIAGKYGDKNVLGFITALRSDSVRDRGLVYDMHYKNMFGTMWALPSGLGEYARVVHMITFMLVEELLDMNPNYHISGRIRKLSYDWRSKLHNGCYIGTPENLVSSARHLTRLQAHEHLLDALRNVYGKILEFEYITTELVAQTCGNTSAELKWIIDIKKSKRRLLSCIKYDPVKKSVQAAQDELRRVLISIIQARMSIVPQLTGGVDAIWVYIAKNIKSAAWIIKSGKRATAVTQKAFIELKDWLNTTTTLVENDHVELDRVMDLIPMAPPEEPVQKVVHLPISNVSSVLPANLLVAGAPIIPENMKLMNELYDAAEDDEDIDWLDSIELDTFSDDQWKAAIITFNAKGVNAAIKNLQLAQNNKEIR